MLRKGEIVSVDKKYTKAIISVSKYLSDLNNKPSPKKSTHLTKEISQ